LFASRRCDRALRRFAPPRRVPRPGLAVTIAGAD
jgi:hypothetical protein